MKRSKICLFWSGYKSGCWRKQMCVFQAKHNFWIILRCYDEKRERIPFSPYVNLFDMKRFASFDSFIYFLVSFIILFCRCNTEMTFILWWTAWRLKLLWFMIPCMYLQLDYKHWNNRIHYEYQMYHVRKNGPGMVALV